MNTYEIQWAFGASTLVEADAYEAEGLWYRFFRGDEKVAQCAKILVRNIQQLRGVRDSRKTAEPECSWQLPVAAA